jgi:anti-sigma factor RsiW
MNVNCNNLDAYLAANLSVDDAARFIEHLQSCDDCREATDQQQWIDGLLRSSANYDAELPRDDVLATLRTAIATRRQKTKLSAGGLAAAVLVVGMGWTVLIRQAGDWTSDRDVRPSFAKNETPREKQPLQATFVSDSNSIAVSIKSRHSDVTVVRIYPVYQPRYDNQPVASDPEAATEENWNVYSNGG